MRRRPHGTLWTAHRGPSRRLPVPGRADIFRPRSSPRPGRSRPAGDRRNRGPGGTVRDEAHRLSIDDGELYLRLRGRGPRVLLLHGLTAHGGAWRRVAARLERRYTLVVPDLLSRGRSEARPDLGHDLGRELDRVRAVARHTDTAGRPVVGHSQGAAIATALAAGPNPPSGLVLVCPVTPWTRRPGALEALRSGTVRRAAAPVVSRLRRPLCRWVLRRRVFADPDRVDPETVERYAAPWKEIRRARALLRVLADWRPRELDGRLPDRPPPCRVIAGIRDRRIRLRDARRLADRMDGGFEPVEGAAHMVPDEAPGAVARALEIVIDQHRRRES